MKSSIWTWVVCFLSLGNVGEGFAQRDPISQFRFVYLVPQDNDNVFGCGGVVGVDVSVQGCTTFAPTADEFVWTLEFQPTPAFKLGHLSLPIVPELSVQHVVPHVEYMHFKDRDENLFLAPTQTSLRFALGYDSYFYNRHLWGNRAMLKAGGACLLTRPLDLNPRREGCDDLDLDNWFVKAYYARTIRIGTQDQYRDIGYLQASLYWEMPDHDFASKPDTSGLVEAFDDDGMHVTYADATFWAKTPSVRLGPLPGILDFRIGGGVGLAHQVETATSMHADVLAAVTPYHNLSMSAGAKYTRRNGSFSGLTEDQAYWSAQAFIQWRPDIVVFWDHRY